LSVPGVFDPRLSNMAEPKASDSITPVGVPAEYHTSTAGPGQDSATTKVIQNAKAATEKEQSMTLMQGIRLYPKAVMWSVLISTCIAMEGYDISLVNNFYAFPQFNQKYGELMADGTTYQVSAAVSSIQPHPERL
jgi:SP family general alpha glucoside:H+ symporter-like MFS transporter